MKRKSILFLGVVLAATTASAQFNPLGQFNRLVQFNNAYEGQIAVAETGLAGFFVWRASVWNKNPDAIATENAIKSYESFLRSRNPAILQAEKDLVALEGTQSKEQIEKQMKKLQSHLKQANLPEAYRQELSYSVKIIHQEADSAGTVLTAKQIKDKKAILKSLIAKLEQDGEPEVHQAMVSLAEAKGRLAGLKAVARYGASTVDTFYELGAVTFVVGASLNIIGIIKDSDMTIQQPTAAERVQGLTVVIDTEEQKKK